MFFDVSYLMVLPAILIAFYAQFKVSSTFSKYLNRKYSRGMTGAEIARYMLDSNGLNDVKVEAVEGRLSDHYDPRTKVVRLSQDVYSGSSISSIGVAAHETGHAIQHKTSYVPMMLRSSLFPVANIGSMAAFPLILIGLFLGAMGGIFIKLGIIFFSLSVLFQIVTLPVEFNASSRALGILSNNGLLVNDELKSTKKVLNAAAFTYVASALVSVMELLRLVLLSRSDD